MFPLEKILNKQNIYWSDVAQLNSKDFEFIRKCALADVPNVNTTGLKKGDYVVRRNVHSKKLESTSKGHKIRYRVESIMFNVVFARKVKGKNKYGLIRSINVQSALRVELDQEYLDSIILGNEAFKEESEIVRSRKAAKNGTTI